MTIVDTKTEFAVFDLGSGRASGIVQSKNKKTIRVRVVDYERNEINHQLHVKHAGSSIKRHIINHNVKFMPPGVIPSGYKLEKSS